MADRTIDLDNEEKFNGLMAIFVPDLYILWQALKMYNMDGEIFTPIVKAVGEIGETTQRGQVIITIRPEQDTHAAMIVSVEAVHDYPIEIKKINLPVFK